MIQADNVKVAIVGIIGLVGLSFALNHISVVSNATSVSGQLWQYYDQQTGISSILLSKVSSKRGGIFGATLHRKDSTKARKGTCSCLRGKGRYYVYLKQVDSIDTKPQGGNFSWVDMQEVMKAVQYAHKKNRYRDIYTKAKNSSTIILDDQLLIALVNKYRDRLHGVSGVEMSLFS